MSGAIVRPSPSISTWDPGRALEVCSRSHVRVAAACVPLLLGELALAVGAAGLGGLARLQTDRLRQGGVVVELERAPAGLGRVSLYRWPLAGVVAVDVSALVRALVNAGSMPPILLSACLEKRLRPAFFHRR